jgi:hypothetical protein
MMKIAEQAQKNNPFSFSILSKGKMIAEPILGKFKWAEQPSQPVAIVNHAPNYPMDTLTK